MRACVLETIRDPIHGLVRIDAWAAPIVEAPAFQRLRRIQQLGTAHLVYPGAHHKRFEHSIGAYHLAGRFASALGLDPHETKTVKAAALVHDVGHGPFSHAFEELLHDEGRRHEETSVDLVRWGPLGDLLRQGGIDPGAVAQLVLGQGPLSSVVSGALDADRLDYLLRDAHYTGVPSSADADRLMAVLVRDPAGTVLDHSGAIVAEAILTMRFLMYPAVYLHHTVRASESMLVAGVRALLDEGRASLAELERETDDGLTQRMRAAGGDAACFANRLDERRLYKRAYEGGPAQADDPRVRQLQSSAKARRAAAAEIAQSAGVPEPHVLVDVPRPPKFRELGVRLRMPDGSLVPLPEASRLVRVLQEARHDHWRFWAFCPKQDVARVAPAAARVLG